MSHARNKVEWCLKKVEREFKKGAKKHRGLLRVKPSIEKAREHITKAEHNLEAVFYLKKGGFSDWCASAAFYSMYHALLAILSKFGYESENQECTFALIYSLIEDKKIDLNKEIVYKITSLEPRAQELTTLEIREQYQYGTKTSIQENLYQELLELAKEVISNAKRIIEE